MDQHVPLPIADADRLEHLARERFSCRAFRPDPVADEEIAGILETAQRTASWCNCQPWQVVITRGTGTERFRTAMYRHAAANPAAPDFPFPREYRGTYRDRRRECGLQLYASLGIGRDAPEAAKLQSLENFRLFGAPHVAIITSPEALGVYGALDCGGYVANFMLAAQSRGIATVPQASIASYPAFVRGYFGLADDRLVICAVSFGYADPDHPANAFRTTRAAITDAVRFVDE